MDLLFVILSALLLLTHCIFFFRAFIYRKRDFKVKFIDRFSRNLSLILLLPTLIIATVIVSNLFLKFVVWLPFVAIVLSNFNKKIIRSYPFLLPAVNLILYLGVLVISIGEML